MSASDEALLLVATGVVILGAVVALVWQLVRVLRRDRRDPPGR